MLFAVGELKGGNSKGETETTLGIKRKDSTLRHLKSLLLRVIYFEGEVIKGKSLEDKDEFFGYFAFGFDVVIILTCIFESEFDTTTGLLLVSDRVLCK